MESPILIAAKMGIKEMVETILDKFPMAIQDVNGEGKNAVHLAVENRQLSVYNYFRCKNLADNILQQEDEDGNSILHLAAKYKKSLIPGGALQMQSEIYWYKFVKKTLPNSQFINRFNHEGKTERQVFIKTHKKLMKAGGQWLNETSTSCSVVAGLIATVAFATATTIPGGVGNDGIPILKGKLAFTVFTITSPIAVWFSVASLIMFLAIAASGSQQIDFYTRVTTKLMLGLTSLFISMASMLVSFYASLTFLLKDQINIINLLILIVACLPITFYSLSALFPLYAYLIRSSFSTEPLGEYLGNDPVISSFE